MYGNNPSSITDFREFEGRGHSLTIDSGWRTVADATLQWLASQRLDLTVTTAASRGEVA